jgi:hypothetical protein
MSYAIRHLSSAAYCLMLTVPVLAEAPYSFDHRMGCLPRAMPARMVRRVSCLSTQWRLRMRGACSRAGTSRRSAPPSIDRHRAGAWATIANMPIARRVVHGKLATTSFARSPKMPSYLVEFTAGDLARNLRRPRRRPFACLGACAARRRAARPRSPMRSDPRRLQ